MHIHDFTSWANKLFTLHGFKHQVNFPDRVIKPFPGFYFGGRNLIHSDGIWSHGANGLNGFKNIADNLSFDPERFLSQPNFFCGRGRTTLPSNGCHQRIEPVVKFDGKPYIDQFFFEVMKLGKVKGIFINIESSTVNGFGRITPVPFIVGIHGKFFRDVRINLRPNKFARLCIVFFFPDIIPFKPSLHVFLRKPCFVPDFIALSF